MANPVIRSVSRNITDGTNTITTPTGAGVTPQAGDTVLVFDGSDFYTLTQMLTPTNTGGITFSAGPTGSTADAGTNIAHIKTWTGSVASNGAFSVTCARSGSGDEDKSLMVVVFAGSVTFTAAVNAAGGSASSYTMPALSAGAADDMIVSFVCSGAGASTASYTTTLTTLDFSLRVGTHSAAGAHEQLSASGSTGTRTWTPAGSVPYALVGVIAHSAGGGGSDVTLNDTSGGASTGGLPDQTAVGVLLADTSGGSSTGGRADTAAVGVLVADGSGGASAGASGSTTSVGVVLAGGSGGAAAGRSADAPAIGMLIPDGSGAAAAGGSGDIVGASTVIADTSGGLSAMASADTLRLGVLLTDTSGGVVAAPSASLVSNPSDVTIGDASGGTGAGASPGGLFTSLVVRDMMVMPVLLSALTCLQDEASKVESPPGIFTVRPGDSFEPSADPWTDECCAGVGWVRMVSSYESGSESFPEPTVRPLSPGCPPDAWAVVIEIGINRCVPVAGDTRGSVVTPEQWQAATQAQMDDGAALRRVLCCLRDLYNTVDVTSGQVNPLPLQANCGGISMQVTIKRDACDC